MFPPDFWLPSTVVASILHLSGPTFPAFSPNLDILMHLATMVEFFRWQLLSFRARWNTTWNGSSTAPSKLVMDNSQLATREVDLETFGWKIIGETNQAVRNLSQIIQIYFLSTGRRKITLPSHNHGSEKWIPPLDPNSIYLLNTAIIHFHDYIWKKEYIEMYVVSLWLKSQMIIFMTSKPDMNQQVWVCIECMMSPTHQ